MNQRLTSIHFESDEPEAALTASFPNLQGFVWCNGEKSAMATEYDKARIAIARNIGVRALLHLGAQESEFVFGALRYFEPRVEDASTVVIPLPGEVAPFFSGSTASSVLASAAIELGIRDGLGRASLGVPKVLISSTIGSFPAVVFDATPVEIRSYVRASTWRDR